MIILNDKREPKSLTSVVKGCVSCVADFIYSAITTFTLPVKRKDLLVDGLSSLSCSRGGSTSHWDVNDF